MNGNHGPLTVAHDLRSTNMQASRLETLRLRALTAQLNASTSAYGTKWTLADARRLASECLVTKYRLPAS